MTIALGLWFVLGVGVADYHGGFITKRATALRPSPRRWSPAAP